MAHQQPGQQPKADRHGGENGQGDQKQQAPRLWRRPGEVNGCSILQRLADDRPGLVRRLAEQSQLLHSVLPADSFQPRRVEHIDEDERGWWSFVLFDICPTRGQRRSRDHRGLPVDPEQGRGAGVILSRSTGPRQQLGQAVLQILERIHRLQLALDDGVRGFARRGDHQYRLVVEILVQRRAKIGLRECPVHIDLLIEVHVRVAPEGVVDDGAVHPLVLCLQRLASEKTALLQGVLVDLAGDMNDRESGRDDCRHQQRDHAGENATGKDRLGLRVGRAVNGEGRLH